MNETTRQQQADTNEQAAAEAQSALVMVAAVLVRMHVRTTVVCRKCSLVRVQCDVVWLVVVVMQSAVESADQHSPAMTVAAVT